jgi:hypothetical protein
MSEYTGPGTVLSFLKLRDPSNASQKALESRLAQNIVPELLMSDGVKSAWLYKAANSAYDKPYVVVYQLSSLASLKHAEAVDLEKASEFLPEDGSLDELVEIDTRVYSMVQAYEKITHGDGMCNSNTREWQKWRSNSRIADIAPIIMLAMMQPREGGEADLDAWYRDEHNEQMSEEPGWWRTTRYSLLNQHSSSLKESEKLSFLAIHEFGEGNTLGEDVKALEPISDWTKKLMSEAKAIDAAIYHKQRQL